MKYRITRHLYAVLTIIILIVGCMPVNVLAEDYTATTVRLLRHEGNIEIKDAKGKKRAVLENVRFNSGETLSTGNKSSASIGLDEEKVLTMDEKSSVEFNKKSKKIELNVKSGQVLLDRDAVLLRGFAGALVDQNLIADLLRLERVLDEVDLELFSQKVRHRVLDALVSDGELRLVRVRGHRREG